MNGSSGKVQRSKKPEGASGLLHVLLGQAATEGIAASREQGKWHDRSPFGFDVGPERYLTPNDDYETAIVILDELDKGASKRDLARRTGVARSTVRKVANTPNRYVGEPTSTV